MGRVTVNAVVENLVDAFNAHEGRLDPAAVRRVEVAEALVDSGATQLSMPRSLLAPLGLDYVRTRQAITASGPTDVRVFGTARLTIQGRDCPVDVTELPDGCPVLVGQIPLEGMDFVIDLPARRVIGNPAHNGEQILELL